MKPLPSVGIDKLLQDKEKLKELRHKNVGVLTNQKTVTQDDGPSAYALHEALGPALKVILTPEHGWSGMIAEGIKVESGHDANSGLPVISLYGGKQSFKELQETFAFTDIIIDLQDMGVRCYTYATTCAKLLEAYVGHPIKIWVCDRPNPLGPAQKGPLLDPAYRSFLAYLDVPFQHGKTMGRLLQDFNETLGDQRCELERIECQLFHTPYAYEWKPPSPNLPSWDAALLYPALVLLEGVNVSEGRGTPFPFTSLGAPGLNHQKLVAFLGNFSERGVRAEPIVFTPQGADLEGQECQGARLIVEDHRLLDSLSLGLDILRFLKHNYDAFKWAPALPCGDDYSKDTRYFIDALLGTSATRQDIEQSEFLRMEMP